MPLPFVERFARRIRGVLSRYDRVVITGTLPEIGHAPVMTSQLRRRNIRIFDDTRFVQPFREEIREDAERTARDVGLEIDYIRRKTFRK